MISLRGKCAADGNYYIEAAVEYYNPEAPGEAPGQWMDTQAARALGLAGKVEKTPFLNSCNGFTADGVTKLRQNAGKDNAQALTDVCASDPKGLSVLEAISDDATRAVIAECRRIALGKVLEALEGRAVARIGKAGRGGVISGSIVVAGFRHVTSRALDVQSHIHLVVLSQILCTDGKWRAIDWKRTLYEKGAKKLLGAIYRTELAYQLQERLGLELTRLKGLDSKENSLYDLKVLEERFKTLLDELSKRRSQVLKLLAEKGESYDARKAAKAVLASRPTKRGHLSENAVREATRKAAKKHGLFPELVREMLGEAKALPKNQDKAYALILNEGVTNLTREHAHFSKVQIEQAVFESAVARGLPVSVVQEKLKATFADPKGPFITVGPEHEARFTTRSILKEEKKLFASLDELRARKTHGCKAARVERVIKDNPQFSNEQAAALRELTSGKRLVVVDGYAGTGKSRVLREALTCWRGYQVIGCAVSAKAAEGLQEATGIQSFTLAKLIGAEELGFRGDLEKGVVDNLKHDLKMLARAAQKRITWKDERIQLCPKSIVVLDESSLVSSKDLLKLAAACVRAKATLVLVGDAAQLGPLGRGAPFLDVCKRYGSVTLTTIVRAKLKWLQRSVKLLSAGRSERALREFARRGLVDIAKNRRQTIEHLVASFAKGGLRDTSNCLALATRNADVDLINKKIQQARRSAGFLGNSVTINGQLLFENDRVLFRKNVRALGVQNGSYGTLQAFDERFQHAYVRLDGSKKVVKVDLREYTHLSLGYCSSNFRAQGVTQDRVLVLGDGLDRAGGYVALSRSRQETKIFLSKDAAGEHLAAFAKSLKSDNSKTLASAHLEHGPTLQLRRWH
jgi:conjugative relaxase-like TrwC/TraI family protein